MLQQQVLLLNGIQRQRRAPRRRHPLHRRQLLAVNVAHLHVIIAAAVQPFIVGVAAALGVVAVVLAHAGVAAGGAGHGLLHQREAQVEEQARKQHTRHRRVAPLQRREGDAGGRVLVLQWQRDAQPRAAAGVRGAGPRARGGAPAARRPRRRRRRAARAARRACRAPGCTAAPAARRR
jgi:hypothetical protein